MLIILMLNKGKLIIVKIVSLVNQYNIIIAPMKEYFKSIKEQSAE